MCALKAEYENVSVRIDALLFRSLPPREARSLRFTLANIKVPYSTPLLIAHTRKPHILRPPFLFCSSSTPSVRQRILPTLTSSPLASPSPLTPFEQSSILSSLGQLRHNAEPTNTTQPRLFSVFGENITMKKTLNSHNHSCGKHGAPKRFFRSSS